MNVICLLANTLASIAIGVAVGIGLAYLFCIIRYKINNRTRSTSVINHPLTIRSYATEDDHQHNT